MKLLSTFLAACALGAWAQTSATPVIITKRRIFHEPSFDINR